MDEEMKARQEHILALIRCIDRKAGQLVELHRDIEVRDETYVFEEISEIITELCKLQKAMTKADRGLLETNEVVEEMCDVYAASYIFLKRLGVEPAEVFNHILQKYVRALKS